MCSHTASVSASVARSCALIALLVYARTLVHASRRTKAFGPNPEEKYELLTVYFLRTASPLDVSLAVNAPTAFMKLFVLDRGEDDVDAFLCLASASASASALPKEAEHDDADDDAATSSEEAPHDSDDAAAAD